MIPFQTKINAMYRGESGWNVKKEKSKKGQRERERGGGGTWKEKSLSHAPLKQKSSSNKFRGISGEKYHSSAYAVNV